MDMLVDKVGALNLYLPAKLYAFESATTPGASTKQVDFIQIKQTL